MFSNFTTITLLAFPLFFELPCCAQVNALQSDKFVDSVGVNVHLSFGGTLYYTNFSLVQTSLSALGVRHVRDGLIDTTWQGYYDRHNQLGLAGIHGDFITSPGQSVSLLQSYPSRMSSSFEAFEGPNEY